ncbi:hypothetical protein FACS189430_02140 [Bacteroidia bacterium]|nr:hypothetical protein FACS189430_02140 [Bacteroidia bacterium]
MEIINDISVKAKKTRILPAEEIHRKYFSGVPADVFVQIVSADVVSSNLQKHKLGKYAKWMLHLYGKNRLKIEDLYKAQEYIPVFDKAVKANKLREKDVNCYKSLAEMYVAIEPFLKRIAISKKEKIHHIKGQEAEKLYEDAVFTVIHPLTEAASCFYGKGTQWCTAAQKSDNQFDCYNDLGTLYIIIDKIRNRKYQFHFESNSFRNETDYYLEEPVLETIEATYGLIRFFQLEIEKKFNSGCDVTDSYLFIFEKDGYYGIRKIDKELDKSFEKYIEGYFDEFHYAEVVLTADFEKIASYSPQNSHNELFVVQKGKCKGLYNYYTDSIRWGYRGAEFFKDNDINQKYKQFFRDTMLFSWPEVISTGFSDLSNVRIHIEQQDDQDISDEEMDIYLSMQNNCPF